MSDDAAEFLDAGFASVPPEQHILVWTLPDKRSRWYRGGDVETIATDVAGLKDRDVYIAAGLSAKNNGVSRRVEAAEVSGLVGLWADVDIAESEAHKKKNLPATEADALAVLDAMGAPPTLVVHSGHGLQAWWFFTEPWIFASQEEHDAAARLSIQWFATMKVRAAVLGWTIDATHDLSRVMRVPGTTNRKGIPVPVRVIRSGGPTYEPLDGFDDYLADEAAMSLLTGRRTHHVGDLVLRADAQPDILMRDAMAANLPLFNETFERKRKDLSDTSPSGYDMALARMAANVGWVDQEIVNLLIYARRHNREDLKLNREDYYKRTIARAREEQDRETSMASIPERTEDLKRAETEVELGIAGPEKVQHARKALLDASSGASRIAVVRVDKLSSMRWVLITGAGPCRPLTTEEFFAITKVRAVVAEVTNYYMPPYPKGGWEKQVQAWLDCAVDVDIGIDTSDPGLCYTWINDYLQDRQTVDDLAEAVNNSLPYLAPDGTLLVMGPALRAWLNGAGGERISRARLGEVLRAGGCSYVKENIGRGTTRTTRSLWRVPPTTLDEFTPPSYEEN